MSAQRVRSVVLLAAMVTGVALVVVGAVVANGAPATGIEDDLKSGWTAYGPVAEQPSGLPWLIAGFALLGLTLTAAIVSLRGRR